MARKLPLDFAINVSSKIIGLALLISFSTSCEKEIEIGYRSTSKSYVIESLTNESGSVVSITRTSNMDQTMDQTHYEASSIRITSSQGLSYPLTLQSNGCYESTEAVAQYDGEIFTLDIDIDDESYSSYSEVVTPPTIKSANIISANVMGINAYGCLVTADRGEGVVGDSYYKYDLYAGDEKILWGVYMHDGDNEQEITLSLIFATSLNGEITATNNDELVIESGDQITVNLVAVDKRGYDYLSTLYLASQSSSNPVDNFSGGALGYYTAYITNSASVVF